jgi:ATPase subunit of ABC transporter with duplicated ATPase domains
MILSTQQISYTLPSRQVLFQSINFTLVKGEKTAIVGNNGTGKSTLLKILAGQLPAQSGTVHVGNTLYYVPQHFGQYNSLTVAQALGIDLKIAALNTILNGDPSELAFETLGDDWDLIERCEQAFRLWELPPITLDQSFDQLSGGEKTKVFLAGITLFKPAIILLDEPTNHLDAASRAQLYEWITTTNLTILVVSHDRQLLQLCDPIWELTPEGIHAYGGNYDFYEEQKALETGAIQQRIAHDQKMLKEARKQQQIVLQRKQRDLAHAEKKGKTGGIPKILLNGRKQQGAVSLAKLQDVHIDKVNTIKSKLDESSAAEQITRQMKGHFNNADLHKGKIMVKATGVNFAYGDAAPLWTTPLDFTITSGSRLAISGTNGSGKSTLIRLMMGQLLPREGELYLAQTNCLLLDQDYSLVDRQKTVLEQVHAFNEAHLEDHQLKTILVRFLFEKDSWDKPCTALSGGETLRLALCCMTLKNNAPDMIILDEPANNLDLNNIKMLTQIFHEYEGTLIVISHDATFLEEVGVQDYLELG